jgi:large subunit ribosomal protein L2
MKKYKPTSASRRGMSVVEYRKELTVTERYKPLTKRLKTHAGRNSRGRITVRHQQGGNKKLYRIIDFKQDKINIPGKVETIEYDPYRSAFIARVLYRDGERRYILATRDLKKDAMIITAAKAPEKTGNRMKLKNITVGTFVSNVEMRPGGGGKLARSAGTYAEVLGYEGKNSILKLSSKETRKVPAEGFATIGQVSNQDYNLVNLGKAGRSRWLGKRPTVRGAAMNPVDHPYGGGEGRQPRGTKRPKTRWGKVTGGRKTRKPKKWSSKFILTRRPKKR